MNLFEVIFTIRDSACWSLFYIREIVRIFYLVSGAIIIIDGHSLFRLNQCQYEWLVCWILKLEEGAVLICQRYKAWMIIQQLIKVRLGG